MPPKTTKTMLSADETRAMQARKAAAKAEQAKKDAEKKQKAAEKAEFEKQKAAKKAEKEAAKKTQEEAAGGAGAGRSKEQELMKLVKKGEKHEEGSHADYELALGCYREAMDGFRSMNAERPKLLEKITRIEKLIEDEATC